EAHLNLKRFEDALEDADRMSELEPDSLQSELVRLRGYIGLERIEDAEMLFVDFEERWGEEGFSEDLGARYCAAHAVFAREKGDLELAEERYEKCLERFPLGTTLVTEAIEFFDGQRRPGRGHEILRRMLELEPARAQARETLAVRLRSAHLEEEAEQVLLEGTQLGDWAALQAWGALGNHYFHLEDYEASLQAWERVMAYVEEPDADLRFGYAEALLRSGRYARALEEAGKLPEVQGELIRGLVRLEQRRPEEALAHFSAGLRLWPNNAVARYYAAIAALEAGDFDQAVSQYRDSIRAGAAHTDAGLQLARLHEAEAAYEPARQALVHHLKAHPDDLDARLMALRLAKRMSRTTPPQQDFSSFSWAGQLGGVSGLAEVAEIVAAADGVEAGIAVLLSAKGMDWTAPPAAPALRVLVTQLCEAGKLDEARSRIDAAQSAYPDTAAFHEVRGLWLECRDAPAAEVRAAYEGALAIDAAHPPALAALGRLALGEGRHAEALEFYRRAAEDESDTESRFKFAELAARAGKRDEAKQGFEDLLEDEPYHARAAAALAELLAEREGNARRAQALVHRAARFGKDRSKTGGGVP
ncbi:MAG: tetratricopeptide repeat protein, partial [Myxococcota bacterium]